MWRKCISVLSVLAFVAGIGILAYPVVSNLYYESQQEKLTEYYDSLVTDTIPEDEIPEELEECWNYNQGLLQGGVLLTDPFDESQLDPSAMPYAGLLNVDGDGAMGYITIPVIDVNLVIYHGTSEDVLQKGVGHLQGTSLPVGGTGSHCVLSAHSGLSSKKLFTDLEQVQEGDVFYLHVLGETLAYQVDQIKVVLPSETDDLRIDANHDYVTLITCTPYGINTHRLLVRGTRIPYEEAEAIQQTTETRPSSWLKQYLQAALVGLSLLLVVLIFLYIWSWNKLRKKRRRKQQATKRRQP